LARLIALVGPTGSGKTAWGLELALALGAEIISVDSLQVYQGMDIGTAKPSLAERALVPHHLIDILTPDQAYNAGRFAHDASAALTGILQRGRPALLLGGTHLYHQALIQGMVEAPEASAVTKARVAALGPSPARYQALTQADPETAARLHPNDVARVTRALEVAWETGIPLTEWRRQQRPPRHEVMYLAPWWPREQLYQRINQRCQAMLERGLLQETQGLLNQGYAPSLPPLRSLGYLQAVAHLQGKINQETMLSQMQQKTRHYAKKQLTWLHKLPLHNLMPEQRVSEVLPLITKYLEQP